MNYQNFVKFSENFTKNFNSQIFRDFSGFSENLQKISQNFADFCEILLFFRFRALQKYVDFVDFEKKLYGVEWGLNRQNRCWYSREEAD